MTHRKYAAVYSVNTPASQARVPALAVDSRLLELSEGDDPMLTCSDARDRRISIGIADFCIHVDA